MAARAQPFPRSLDDTDWQILHLLQADARLSYREIGRRVSLSTPAVTERVRKLEEAGIIRGYRAVVHPPALGHTITAFMQLTVPKRLTPHAIALLRTRPEVIECHHVTGDISFILKLCTDSMARLEALMQELGRFGETNTMIVLSTPIEAAERTIAPLP